MRIFGKKIQMTHVEHEFNSLPVTIVDVSENVVAKIAGEVVTLGWGKKKNPTKAQLGNFKELGFAPYKTMEVGLSAEGLEVGAYEVKDLPEKVNVTGTSKGKGYAGVMRRYNFSGVGGRTHGASDKERAPGSIGAGTTPGRVLKGKRMGGRMGSDRVTVKNLDVVKMFSKDNKTYLLIKGAVAGPNGSLIQISW